MRLYEDDPNIPLNWPILYIGCKDWGKKKCNWKGGGCNIGIWFIVLLGK